MKTFLFALIVLIVSTINAQNELLGYVPLRTYHFNREYLNLMHPTEGGNLGAILIYRMNTNETFFKDVQIGVIRNSFGNTSAIAMFGIGFNTKDFRFSINTGLASGYHEAYKGYNTTENGAVWSNNNDHHGMLPGLFKNNGILPVAIASMTIRTGTFIEPVINVSPIWTNVGIIINLKNK